jgi:hypothetical protein
MRFGGKDAAAFTQAGRVGIEDERDLIADASELSEDFVFGAFGMSGIIEAPMVAVYLARIHRACLVGISAHRDHRGDFPIQKIVHVLRRVAGDVDPDFLHYLDCLRMHIAGRLRTGTVDLDEVTRGGAKTTLRHVTATRVSGAKDEDVRLHEKGRSRHTLTMAQSVLAVRRLGVANARGRLGAEAAANFGETRSVVSKCAFFLDAVLEAGEVRRKLRGLLFRQLVNHHVSAAFRLHHPVALQVTEVL